jgi:hypothetical protein
MELFTNFSKTPQYQISYTFWVDLVLFDGETGRWTDYFNKWPTWPWICLTNKSYALTIFITWLKDKVVPMLNKWSTMPWRHGDCIAQGAHHNIMARLREITKNLSWQLGSTWISTPILVWCSTTLETHYDVKPWSTLQLYFLVTTCNMHFVFRSCLQNWCLKYNNL